MVSHIWSFVPLQLTPPRFGNCQFRLEELQIKPDLLPLNSRIYPPRPPIAQKALLQPTQKLYQPTEPNQVLAAATGPNLKPIQRQFIPPATPKSKLNLNFEVSYLKFEPSQFTTTAALNFVISVLNRVLQTNATTHFIDQQPRTLPLHTPSPLVHLPILHHYHRHLHPNLVHHSPKTVTSKENFSELQSGFNLNVRHPGDTYSFSLPLIDRTKVILLILSAKFGHPV